MKKILHIISQYPGKTGSGVYLNELIREADKKGYQQALVGAIDEEGYNNPLIKDENLYLLEFNTDEIPFPIIGMSDEMPYRTKRYFQLTDVEIDIYRKAFRERIKLAIEEFKPDMILTHHLWLVTSMVKELAKDIKVVGLCHGTDIRQAKQLGESFEPREEILNGCRDLDLVLALNREQKEEVRELYNISNKKITIIGGGYNGDIFYPDFSPRDRIRIVYAGKISFAKGLLPAIEAINNIDDRYEFEFVLVGSGQGEEYEKIVDKSQESLKDIRLVGEKTQKEVGEIFRKSDIFLMPSYYEGLSLVTIEALASGLLIVSSEIEGLMSYLGDKINSSGLIEYVALPKMERVDLPVENRLHIYEEGLKLAIEKQVGRLDKRQSIYKSIRKDIEMLSWEKIFEKIETSI